MKINSLKEISYLPDNLKQVEVNKYFQSFFLFVSVESEVPAINMFLKSSSCSKNYNSKFMRQQLM